ncbi:MULTISPECIES: hypothetical protein [Nocardia]|uniref:hypothetical protein n=1 Tax=Nocardia TaxID=1817 RepID=UPI0013007E64|nr:MULTISPECIES: hypothetical protein [Nocardia]
MRESVRAARTYRVTRIGAAALLGFSVLLTSACLDEETTGTPVTSAEGGVGGPQAPAGTGAQPDSADSSGRAVVRTVGKTGWFEGFEITVDKATVVPDEYGGGKVLIDITYENTGLEAATLSNNSHLEMGREVDGGAGFDNPTVPGKGTATGKVTTPVQVLKDADHLLDTITVVYGEASDNQTRIPLAASSKVESVQPRTLPITGTLVQDPTTVEITGGTLGPSYAKNERGADELALRIKLVGGAGIPDGGTNIYYQYFSLKTPDGRTVVADFRGTINELLGRGETIDNPRNYVIFVVPTPVAGQYVLTYNADKDPGTAASMPFTVS